MAVQMLGQVAVKRERYDDAWEWFQKLVELGKESFDRQDYAQALAQYEKALPAHRNDPDLNGRIGQCLSALDQCPEALDYLEASIKGNRRVRPEYSIALGLCYGKIGQREKAAKELRKFNSPEVVGALMTALQRDGKSEVRQEAAKSLGELQARGAQPALRQAAREDTDGGVRKAALKSAMKIEASYGIQP